MVSKMGRLGAMSFVDGRLGGNVSIKESGGGANRRVRIISGYVTVSWGAR